MEERRHSGSRASEGETPRTGASFRLTQVEWLLIVVVIGILATIALRPDKSGRLVVLFAAADLAGMWAVFAGARREILPDAQPVVRPGGPASLRVPRKMLPHRVAEPRAVEGLQRRQRTRGGAAHGATVTPARDTRRVARAA